MNIYDFVDYRAFLRAYIAKLPKKGRGEINRWAVLIGVHPSLLSQTLSDTKNISLEQAQLLCEGLGLTPQEVEYFLCSVQLQRAGTSKLQNYFKEKLFQLKNAAVEISQRVRQDRSLSDEEKSIFYSHWLYAAMWLLTSLKGGQTLDEVVSKFQITRARALDILNFLAETQLCVVANGRYSMGPQSLHLDRKSPHVTKHHTNWRLRAIEASDKISEDEMMYTAPLSLSKADLKKIRGRMMEVIKEVTETAIPSEAEELVCFNLDLFFIKK